MEQTPKHALHFDSSRWDTGRFIPTGQPRDAIYARVPTTATWGIIGGIGAGPRDRNGR